MSSQLDWDEVVEDLGPRLFKYFCVRFSQEQADDLTQETLIRLVRKVEEGKFMRSLCEQSAVKKYIELHLLDDFLQDEDAEIEMFAPYHIAKEVSLKNLLYKLEDEMLFVRGDYDLKLGFAFEYDPSSDPSIVEDQEMSGSFELSIDRNKKITFEDQTIGL